eukprot:Rmarinus@m.19626
MNVPKNSVSCSLPDLVTSSSGRKLRKLPSPPPGLMPELPIPAAAARESSPKIRKRGSRTWNRDDNSKWKTQQKPKQKDDRPRHYEDKEMIKKIDAGQHDDDDDDIGFDAFLRETSDTYGGWEETRAITASTPGPQLSMPLSSMSHFSPAGSGRNLGRNVFGGSPRRRTLSNEIRGTLEFRGSLSSEKGSFRRTSSSTAPFLSNSAPTNGESPTSKTRKSNMTPLRWAKPDDKFQFITDLGALNLLLHEQRENFVLDSDVLSIEQRSLHYHDSPYMRKLNSSSPYSDHDIPGPSSKLTNNSDAERRAETSLGLERVPPGSTPPSLRTPPSNLHNCTSHSLSPATAPLPTAEENISPSPSRSRSRGRSRSSHRANPAAASSEDPLQATAANISSRAITPFSYDPYDASPDGTEGALQGNDPSGPVVGQQLRDDIRRAEADLTLRIALEKSAAESAAAAAAAAAASAEAGANPSTSTTNHTLPAQRSPSLLSLTGSEGGRKGRKKRRRRRLRTGSKFLTPNALSSSVQVMTWGQQSQTKILKNTLFTDAVESPPKKSVDALEEERKLKIEENSKEGDIISKIVKIHSYVKDNAKSFTIESCATAISGLGEEASKAVRKRIRDHDMKVRKKKLASRVRKKEPPREEKKEQQPATAFRVGQLAMQTRRVALEVASEVLSTLIHYVSNELLYDVDAENLPGIDDKTIRRKVQVGRQLLSMEVPASEDNFPASPADTGLQEYYRACRDLGIKPHTLVVQRVTLALADLGRKSLDCKQGKAIAACLKENSRIAKLVLDDNEIRTEGCAAIATSLRTNDTITSLSLRNNENGWDGAQELAKALCVNTRISTLCLAKNGLRSMSVDILCTAIAHNATITSLDLSENSIGDRGAEHVARMMAKNYTIEKLDLRWNGIQAIGGKAIARAMEINRHIVTLDLGWNGLSDPGAIAMAEMLNANSTLLNLSLRQNGVGGDGGMVLSFTIQRNQTLEKLDLTNNALGAKTVRAIWWALKINKKLNIEGLETTEVCGASFQDIVEYDEKDPSGTYCLDLSKPWDFWVLSKLVARAEGHNPTFVWKNVIFNETPINKNMRDPKGATFTVWQALFQGQDAGSIPRKGWLNFHFILPGYNPAFTHNLKINLFSSWEASVAKACVTRAAQKQKEVILHENFNDRPLILSPDWKFPNHGILKFTYVIKESLVDETNPEGTYDVICDYPWDLSIVHSLLAQTRKKKGDKLWEIADNGSLVPLKLPPSGKLRLKYESHNTGSIHKAMYSCNLSYFWHRWAAEQLWKRTRGVSGEAWRDVTLNDSPYEVKYHAAEGGARVLPSSGVLTFVHCVWNPDLVSGEKLTYNLRKARKQCLLDLKEMLMGTAEDMCWHNAVVDNSPMADLLDPRALKRWKPPMKGMLTVMHTRIRTDTPVMEDGEFSRLLEKVSGKVAFEVLPFLRLAAESILLSSDQFFTLLSEFEPAAVAGVADILATRVLDFHTMFQTAMRWRNRNKLSPQELPESVKDLIEAHHHSMRKKRKDPGWSKVKKNLAVLTLGSSYQEKQGENPSGIEISIDGEEGGLCGTGASPGSNRNMMAMLGKSFREGRMSNLSPTASQKRLSRWRRSVSDVSDSDADLPSDASRRSSRSRSRSPSSSPRARSQSRSRPRKRATDVSLQNRASGAEVPMTRTSNTLDVPGGSSSGSGRRTSAARSRARATDLGLGSPVVDNGAEKSLSTMASVVGAAVGRKGFLAAKQKKKGSKLNAPPQDAGELAGPGDFSFYRNIRQTKYLRDIEDRARELAMFNHGKEGSFQPHQLRKQYQKQLSDTTYESMREKPLYSTIYDRAHEIECLQFLYEDKQSLEAKKKEKREKEIMSKALRAILPHPERSYS